MKNSTRIASIIGLLTLSNLVFTNAANAFSVTFDDGSGNTTNLADFNTGFESQYTGWSTNGDTTVPSTFQNISTQSGIGQALITNSCGIGSQCQDKDGGIRNDDSHVNNTAGTFNYSGNDQINASVEADINLQSFLKISDNGLSIPAKLNGVEIPGVFRTPKEGSAILSDKFTVDEGFKFSFDWNYLTNDGASALGNQDFSFVTITGTTSGGAPVEQVIPLGDSSGSIPSTTSNNFAEVTGYETYSATALEAGTYRVGFGVVDTDNVDRSSALLVDDFNIEEVPFEFSPALGLIFVSSIFSLNYLRRKVNSNNILEKYRS